jgi:pantetheine-phosphate adenylyltransferase
LTRRWRAEYNSYSDTDVGAKAGFVAQRVVAVYPGSFDPITNGHLDLIERGSKIFDELIVAVLRNPEKDPLFTPEERLEMLREATQHCSNISVDSFHGLLVNYAVRKQARVILRGIRAVSDFENEMTMALMNRKLDGNLETVFMMPSVSYTFLSSRLVREIVRFGGDVRGLVPPLVEARLRAKVG